MSTFDEIKALNPDTPIHSLEDPIFADYGVVYKQYDIHELKTFMDASVTIPDVNEANLYRPSNPAMEKIPVVQMISRDVFAGMPTAAGECAGHADALTAFEFHQGSEVNVFFTDVIMVIAKRGQLHDYHIDAHKEARCFFVPAGTVVEFFSDTLHYSPCEVHASGFKFIVLVLKGTNQPLPEGFKANNPLITKQNKFQITHESRKDKIAAGVYPGLTGELVTIKHLTD